ncbi:MAG: hypothetical protein IKN31_08335 [Bacteroidales bacterium]|nr:hypothetical protein [Bacteroidales bacterium]
MKKSLVLALLAFLAISSCQKPETKDVVSEDIVFTATMEAIIDDATAVDTKTSLDNGNIRWKQGDQVSIFNASYVNECHQVTDESDGKTYASFYQVSRPGGFVAGGEIPNNVAFYPYASTAGIAKSGNNYVISDIALPATQDYANASFGSGAFPMAAMTGSTGDFYLKFKNVLGGLKLQLKGTAAITSISVTGNNSEKLCGAASVTVSSTADPTIELTDATATTVTLDCGDGVQLDAETATAFVIALPPRTMNGGFTVTVTDSQGREMEIKTTKSQTITRSNILKMPAVTVDSTPSHEYVDLGLTSGVKWATCNVGASAPEEYGDYFAWGETEPYYSCLDPLTWKDGKSSGYTWGTYKWCEGSYDTQTKYCTNSSFGNVDGKAVLDPEDDAATANWGGNWRMPTDEEWAELLNECTWTWTTLNGVNGRLVTSNTNGNSIFLPAPGSWFETEREDDNVVGDYWSSSLYPGSSDYAWCMYVDGYSIFHTSYCRFFGQSVRPVMN